MTYGHVITGSASPVVRQPPPAGIPPLPMMAVLSFKSYLIYNVLQIFNPPIYGGCFRIAFRQFRPFEGLMQFVKSQSQFCKSVPKFPFQVNSFLFVHNLLI